MKGFTSGWQAMKLYLLAFLPLFYYGIVVLSLQSILEIDMKFYKNSVYIFKPSQ